LYNPTAFRIITAKLVTLSEMKPTVMSGKANICLTYFLLRMVCNKAMICLSKCLRKVHRMV
jgi:hypothetical protein